MIRFVCDDNDWNEMYKNYLCHHNCSECYHKICNYENAKKLFKLWKEKKKIERGNLKMRYEFETKERITSCEECPCNYLDGHENFCKLAEKFNISKDSKDCPLIEHDSSKIGGTNND